MGRTGAPDAAAAPGGPGEAGGVAEAGGPAGEEAGAVPATVGDAGTGPVGGAADGAEAGPAPCFTMRPGAAAGWGGDAPSARPTLLSGCALIPEPPAPGSGCCWGTVPGFAPPARAACARDVPAGPGA
ncbi:MAG TPA: hypothetical protein VGN41_19615 [Streptosporangiaceae bacterium]